MEPERPLPKAPDALEPVAAEKPESTEPMLFCPACDQRLEQHKCKLVCTRCGYYMSCADYY